MQRYPKNEYARTSNNGESRRLNQSIYVFIDLSIHLSIYLSVCLFLMWHVKILGGTGTPRLLDQKISTVYEYLSYMQPRCRWGLHLSQGTCADLPGHLKRSFKQSQSMSEWRSHLTSPWEQHDDNVQPELVGSMTNMGQPPLPIGSPLIFPVAWHFPIFSRELSSKADRMDPVYLQYFFTIEP